MKVKFISLLLCCFSAISSFAGDVACNSLLSEDCLNAVLLQHKDAHDDCGEMVVVDTLKGGIVKTATFGSAEDKDFYEAGSVIKAITVAIAIDTGSVGGDTLIETKIDKKKYPSLPLDGGHKWEDKMTVADALVRSSNIVIGKLGADIGRDTLVRGFERFGFTVDDVVPVSRVAVGQGFRVSTMQIANAYAILFNHGVEGRTGRRIVSAKSADAVCEILKESVTSRGTGRRAAVNGVWVAGKTGTAIRVLDGKYTASSFNALFAGACDVGGRRYVVVARYANRGGGNHQGGQRPAEAFADVARGLKDK